MNYKGKNGLRVDGKQVWHEGNFNPTTKANVSHSHYKRDIRDFPTKLSEFNNDIGLGSGGGTKIVASRYTPSGLVTDDWWFKEV